MKTFLTLLTIIFSIIIIKAQSVGSFIDERDGRQYSTVSLGGQIWMAENLAFKSEKGSWAYEKNDTNVLIYGYLYNWKTACKVCPSGWKLPSKKDYIDLVTSLKAPDSLVYANLIDGGTSGFKAKLAGWYAGHRFGQLNEHTDFWTETDDPATHGGAYRFSLYKRDQLVYMNADFTNYAFSVRCIRQ